MSNSKIMQTALPELLCPVGSKEALKAAIAGGADAVYMGGASFHARMHATLFTQEELCESIRLAHAYGVKVYITMNTLVLDLELPAWLNAAYAVYQAGADGIIVDDFGAAAEIHRQLPELALHASTQMSIHHSNAGEMLQKLGYSRMVVARESSLEDLQLMCQKSPIEIEAFVHGALCVSHSGQCLFSSIVGGRSGNRGTCAQPCRLPYFQNGKQRYPLSLKDLTLAGHIPELLQTGVASLKIEGRMKSPEYVYTTTKIWRTLLDERRSASEAELREMGDAFSREGFTDAYFTSEVKDRHSHSMLGIRTNDNKSASAQIPPFPGLTKKVPIDMHFSMHENQPLSLTILKNGESPLTVEGEYPELAKTAPLTQESVIKQLTKLGATAYTANHVEIDMDNHLMIPLSILNNLRRKAIEQLDSSLFPYPQLKNVSIQYKKSSLDTIVTGKSACFSFPEQVTEQAKRYFDYQYLPIWKYHGETNGFSLPPVMFDGEEKHIRKMIEEAISCGAQHVLVSNPWHLPLVQETNLQIHADFRFNVTNRESLASWNQLGISDLILSPELTLPQCRDLMPNGRVIVYGHLPLMLVEKCIGREIGSCQACDSGLLQLVDRKGVSFPIIKEWGHRNILCNGDVTWMADQLATLNKYRIQATHFIFTIETNEEVDHVIQSYEIGSPCNRSFRRIGVALDQMH